ncbi:MAG: RagB/SusD family nutrient uptake outer membrane protein [Candidatus Amulumruptor sp.]|nr:RagB/SusD family nutrient uptake outer membrane protein [Candidatus Amulumruptor sp.]
MKSYIKSLGFGLFAGVSLMFSSCNDSLDLGPVTQITPDDYYKTPDQLQAYVNNYFNSHLVNPFSGAPFHQAAYNSGMNRSDVNTDICLPYSGSTTLFADGYWLTSSGKVLQSYYANIRVWNYFINKVETNLANGDITGGSTDVNHYLGEAYFFRALCYYRALALYGDLPIVTDVLDVDDEAIVEASKRAPRNEVARFIISDLEKAASLMYDRDHWNGQRISREVANLVLSRVALFEATFEKYHKGSGRVPGDSNWPGKDMSYNSGKSFDIEGEINFFLDKAMTSAKAAVGNRQLTANNKVLEPAYGQLTGWNPYFEMYSQSSLANVEEVLLWKQYSAGLNVKHNSPFRSIVGDGTGMTRAFVDGFLMTDGLPYYASNLYEGDKMLDDVKANRDYRLQLFVWGESTTRYIDPAFGELLAGEPYRYGPMIEDNTESRNPTGIQARKYVTYDYSQTWHDQILGVNACPVFRIAEAMLNYMEACAEKTGSVDATAQEYWKKLRNRAGVDEDFNKTIAATDLSKEGQLSVYSGTTPVSALIFNIRRERVAETFNEGLRMADLIRWRSFDRMLTQKWIPEGRNFWDEFYDYTYVDEKGQTVKPFENLSTDGSSSAMLSGRDCGKYLRPYQVNMTPTNMLRDGLGWTEAYYLYPLGFGDITTASPDRLEETSNMYQNINWPTQGGAKALK